MACRAIVVIVVCCRFCSADFSGQLDPTDKMRLFMAYLATHPEKLDPTKKQQWQKVARLDAQDMSAVCNLAFLNVAVMKQPGVQVRVVVFCYSGGMCLLPVEAG